MPYYSADHDRSAGKTVHESINEKMDYDNDGGGTTFDDSGERTTPTTAAARKVEVAELRVRLPQHSRWVHVDKCQFSAGNRTLDTRLVFPDLTISGRVLVQPNGGRCDMILRLRQAGIEFRTVPIVEERSRAATVRTDSHFAEPGFISVFAHGCDSGGHNNKYRQNSKRQQAFYNRMQEQQVTIDLGDAANDYGRHYRYGRSNNNMLLKRRFDNVIPEHKGGLNDLNNANDDIRFDDAYLRPNYENTESRTFSEYFANSLFANRYQNGGAGGGAPGAVAGQQWQNVEFANSDEMDEAHSREMEDLFSKGVRSLLTKYMQKALQPAIKETLMESMGYTLSYG